MGMDNGPLWRQLRVGPPDSSEVGPAKMGAEFWVFLIVPITVIFALSTFLVLLISGGF